MASKLSMVLSSSLLRVEAGATATVTITLRNLAFDIEQYVIVVEGIDPFWYQASAHSVAVAPQSESEIQLSLHPPRSGDVRAGPYPFVVKAISRTNPDEMTTAEAVLQVEPLAGLEIELSPRILTDSRERCHVRLTNRSEHDNELVLSGRDREGVLQFDFQPSFIVLQQGQSVEVSLKVRRRRGRWLRRDVERDFQIMAAPRGIGWDSEQAHIVSGVLADKPDPSQARTSKRSRVAVFAMAIVLLVAVAATAWAVVQPGSKPPSSDPAVVSPVQAEPAAATTSPSTLAPSNTPAVSVQNNPAVDPPQIQRFVAQRAEDNRNVLLMWDVLNAEEVRINDSIVSPSGSQQAAMDRDGAYILTAKNRGGASTSTVYVVMVCPPSILSFDVVPSSVQRGQTATLSWDIFGATQSDIDGRLVPMRGSVVIAPSQSTRFVLTSTNEAGTSQSEVFLDVAEPPPTPEMPVPTVPPPLTLPPAPPPAPPAAPPVRQPPVQPPTATPIPIGPPPSIQSFTASPNLLTHWDKTTLSWSVSGAAAVFIEPGVGSVDSTGTRSVVVPSTTTYVLTAVSASGQMSTAKVDVASIAPPYIVAFDAPTRGTIGSSINLSWNTTGTSDVVISWTDDSGTHTTQTFTTPSGSTQITPAAANPRGVVVTLTAKNQAGTVATAVRTITLVRP